MDLLWKELEKNAKFFDDDEKRMAYKILNDYLFEEYLYDAEIDEETSVKKLEEFVYTANASVYSLKHLVEGKRAPLLIYNLSKRINDVNNNELRRFRIRVTKRLHSLDKNMNVDIEYIDLNEFDNLDIFRRNLIKTVDDFHEKLVEYLYLTDTDYMWKTLDPNIIKVVMLDEKDERFRFLEDEYAGISAYRSSCNYERFPYNDYIIISVDDYFDFVDEMSFLVPHEYGHKMFLTHIEDLVYFICDEEIYTDDEYSMIMHLLHKKRTIMSDMLEFGTSKHFNFIDRIKLYSIKELYKIAKNAIGFD